MNPKKKRRREKGNREGSVKETVRTTPSVPGCQLSREAATENSTWPWVQSRAPPLPT